jgi:hypothetical protein
MSKINYPLIYLIISSLFCLIAAQVNVLGPPSVVQKVKELEDGSKKFIFTNKK